MDTAVDSIVVVDELGLIRSFNRAAQRLFGYAEQEVLGSPLGLLMPEPHRSAHQQYISRYLATGDSHIIGIGREIEALHKSGARIPIYLAVSEFQGPQGRCFAGVLHDISPELEARDLRNRLVQTERLCAMAEMTAAVAHELSQPLSTIAIYAQAARQLVDGGVAASQRVGVAVDKVIEEVKRAGQAVERVRRLFKGLDSCRERADINALVLDVVELARVDARSHDIEVGVSAAGDLPCVDCDRVQIQQVGHNLIRNAIDSMLEVDCRNGRSISVATSLVDGAVRVEVRDSGHGVVDEAGDSIFAPFNTTKTAGFGVGLAICRTIILNHDGVLEYDNVLDDGGNKVGAIFWFTLPV